MTRSNSRPQRTPRWKKHSQESRRRKARGFDLEVLEPRQVLSALGVIDPPGANIDASTFTATSFRLSNTSTTGQQIERVHLDLSSAIFRDVIFDPFGTGGDPVGKPLTIDSEGGTGFDTFQYLQPHDGGFDALEMLFTDFDPGETITFSIDNDPTSIKGLPDPGPNHSGSISGLEMIGAQVTVDFSDATSITSDYYRIPSSVDGSQAFVETGVPVQPTIEILGVPATPTTVSSANQTVRVSGPVGASVALLVVEGALYEAGGGFELEPYEANTAIAINEVFDTITATGFVDIPITLTNSDPDGGTNHIVAALVDSGTTGPLSSVEILQFGGDEKVQFTTSAIYQDVEGTGDSTVLQLVRTGDTSGTGQVEVDITGGSATAGVDYDDSSFPLLVTFDPGETTKTVTIPITQDTEVEIDEEITLDVSAVTSLVIGSNNTATLQIIDDEVPTVEFSQSGDYQDIESIGTSTVVTLIRTGDTSGTDQVEVDVTGGSATAGADYNASSFPLLVTFGVGETTKSVSVPIVQDTQEESYEEITFDVTTVSGVAIGANDTATLQIVDDDASTAIRINSGGANYTDVQGHLWQADTLFSGGETFSRSNPISGTSDDTLYQSERYGNFFYNIPVSNGTHHVNLKFAEIYWTIPGRRLFDVSVEGQLLIDDLDLFAEAGTNVAFDQFLPGISVTDGELNIQLTTVADNAKISAVEVLGGAKVEFSQAAPYQDGEDAGSSNVVTLRRTGDTNLTSQVEVDTTGGSATPGSDYNDTSFPLLVTFTPGATTRTVTVPILQDLEAESTEDVLFGLTSVSGATLGAIDTATLEILDDDSQPIIEFSQAGPYSDDEDAGNSMVVTLTRSGDLSGTSEVHVNITGGTATPGDDFDDSSFPLLVTFAPTESAQTVTVPIVQDTEQEGTEHITFDVTVQSNAVIGAVNTATLEIQDDDFPPSVEFSQATPYQDSEGAGNSMVVTLTRSGGTSGSSVVQVDITGGSAVAGTDYDASSFPLLVSFGTGETTKPVTVPITQDTEDELLEDITFAVSTVSGALIGATNTATLQILDDDNAEEIRINAGGPSYTDVSGNVWQADTLFSGGTTFSRANAIAGTEDDPLYHSERYGNFSYNIPVNVGDHDVTLKFAEIYWTLPGRRIFDVTVEGQVLIDNLDLFAEAGTNTAFDVLLPDVAVADGELNIEFTTVADNAKVSAIQVVKVLPSVEFSQAAPYQDDEGTGDSTVVTLIRSGDTSGTSQVQVNITGGSALPPGDYDNASFPLLVTFGPGETTQAVTVPIVQDSEQEPTEDITFDVTLLSNSQIGATNTATLEINDDDSQPTVEFAQSTPYQELESVGNSMVVTLTRTGNVSGTSLVEVSITGGSATATLDYDDGAFPMVVNFGVGVTSVPVTIPIVQDTAQEPTEDISLLVNAISGAVIGATSTATLEILDDDVPTEIRINSGGPSYTDVLGQVWQADTLFSGGETFTRANPIAGTEDDLLYQSERYGNFFYNIPVNPGTFDINLKFAEIFWTVPGQRLLDVSVEGQLLIDNLDIFAMAGTNTALDQLLPGIQVTDGELNIEFITVQDNAKISAIEVINSPTRVEYSQGAAYQDDEGVGTSNAVTLVRSGDTSGTSQVEVSITGGSAVAGSDYDGSSFPLQVTFGPNDTTKTVPVPILQDSEQEGIEDITFDLAVVSGTALGAIDTAALSILDDEDPLATRINVGGPTYVDQSGNSYLSDQFFTGGSTASTTAEIHKTDDDPLYQTEREGSSFSYDIPITNGNYLVNLHFSENVHNDFGQRIFDVLVEGIMEVDDLDIYARSINAFFPGKNSALIITIPQVSVLDNVLDLDLQSSVDIATLSAIEVMPLVGPLVLLSQTNGNTEVTEGGPGDSYSLVLNSEPTDDVTVTIQPGGQLTVNPVSVTFTPLDYHIPQVINIDAIDDSAQEGTQTIIVGHTVSSNDPGYDGIAVTPDLSVRVFDDDVPPVAFTAQSVASMSMPTTAAWGPDGRLYVGSVAGEINAYTFDENYNVTDTQLISTIQGLSNLNILGIGFSPFDESDAPTIFVAHSELFANGGGPFPETELSPYSGQVSLLEGPDFSVAQPLITGLPVSNHDHGINGLAFDNQGDLFIAIGGNTNAGVTHGNIGGVPESPFSAAIVKATITDADFNGTIEYELPPEFEPPSGLTFPPEISQVFGDVASVVAGVDVTVYADGTRNPYGIVWTTSNQLYATDNGPNQGFGDASTGPDTEEPAASAPDELLLIEQGEYYGHPNRNRGMTDPRQNVYHPPSENSIPGVYTEPLAIADPSTNGIDEYRSTVFGGQLRGTLFAQQWNSKLYNYTLSPDGLTVVNTVTYTGIASGLDVVMGPGGAILGIDFAANEITVATPDTTVTDPTAYDIFPWRAPFRGGNTFTIGGENFGNLGNTTVTIGGEVATLTSVNSNRIIGVLPEFAVTEVFLDVVVTSDGTVSTITEAFMPLDVPSSEIQFSQAAAYQDGEDAGNSMVVTLTRTGDTNGTSVVEVNLTGGSATANVDYDATVFPQVVTFDPGVTSQTVTVPILQDLEEEGDENITFLVTLISDATIGTNDTATLIILDDEAPLPTVQFSQATAYQDNESAGSSTVVELTRSGDTSGISEVLVSVNGGTAIAGADYDASSFPLTVTFGVGETVQAVTVPILQDNFYENTEDILLGVTDISGVNIGPTNTAALEILDDDPLPTVEFSQSSAYQAGESAGSGDVTLTLTGDTSVAADVLVSITGGVAAEGLDYDGSAFPVLVSFAPGATLRTVNLPILQDSLHELDEDITFEVTAVSAVSIGTLNTASLEILDDDPQPTVEFSQSTAYQTGEGAGASNVVTLTLSGETSLAAEVLVSITGGEAVDGSDYDGSSFPVSVPFAPGSTSQSVVIPILQDTIYELDEDLTLDVTSVFGATIGTNNNATLQILDDDPLPVVEFSQAAPYQDGEGAGSSTVVTLTLTGSTSAAAEVAVNITGGDAVDGSDYDGSSFPQSVTFAPGETSQTVTVPILQDGSHELDEQITLDVVAVSGAAIGTIDSASLQILDDDPVPTVEFSQTGLYQDGEGAGTSTVVTLTLTGDTSVAAEVEVSITGGNAAAGSDYDAGPFPQTVIFAPGETSQTVAVPILQDTQHELNEEIDFQVAAVAEVAIGTVDTGTLQILDDDPAPTIEFSQATAYQVGEGEGIGVLTLTLTGDTSVTAEVSVGITGGIATAGADYDGTSFPVLVTFAPGTTSQTVNVPILQDSVHELDEEIDFEVTAVSAATIGPIDAAALQILDDDPAPTVEFSQSASYQAGEDAGDAVLTLTLTGATSVAAQVQVDITGSTATAGSDYDGSSFPLLVTFPPGVTSQDVDVPILQNTTHELTENVSFEVTAVSEATIGSLDTALLLILDDDPVPAVSFSQTAAYQDGEDAGISDEVTLTLSGDSDIAAEVQVTITGGTATDGKDYSGSSFPLSVTFDPGETSKAVSVPILQDTLYEGLEDIAFEVGVISGATLGAVNTATLEIVEDDPVGGGSAPAVSRTNSGGPDYTDASSRLWIADAAFVGGSIDTTTSSISGTVDDPLYQDARSGDFSYAVSVTNGTYFVSLRFAEIVFTSVGERVFDVEIEDLLVSDDLDIVSRAGANAAFSQLFLTFVADGQLNVDFIGVTSGGTVSGVEIFRLGSSSGLPPETTPEGEGVNPERAPTAPLDVTDSFETPLLSSSISDGEADAFDPFGLDLNLPSALLPATQGGEGVADDVVLDIAGANETVIRWISGDEQRSTFRFPQGALHGDAEREGGLMELTLTRSGDTTNSLRLFVSVASDGTSDAADSELSNLLVVFRPGMTSQSVTVPVLQDGLLMISEAS